MNNLDKCPKCGGNLSEGNLISDMGNMVQVDYTCLACGGKVTGVSELMGVFYGKDGEDPEDYSENLLLELANEFEKNILENTENTPDWGNHIAQDFVYDLSRALVNNLSDNIVLRIALERQDEFLAECVEETLEGTPIEQIKVNISKFLEVDVLNSLMETHGFQTIGSV